jgi:hypothetical protein
MVWISYKNPEILKFISILHETISNDEILYFILNWHIIGWNFMWYNLHFYDQSAWINLLSWNHGCLPIFYVVFRGFIILYLSLRKFK